MLREDQTQIPITKELRDELKSLGKKGQTYEEIIRMLIKKNPPTHTDSTHTHKATKGVSDVLEWIEENNPKGITKDRITQAIKDLKGYDTRTIQKYEPIVLQKIQENGFRQHPNNPNLFIRYEL